MHDCPGCRVPLHGYEEVCPSCGTRQVVRRGSSRQFSNFKPEQPSINWMPFVAGFVVIGAIGAFALSSSWVGRIMREGKPAEDPMEKMTYQQARATIEQELTTGLAAVGAQPTISWIDPSSEKPADKNLDQPENIKVDVALADPNSRKPIIDKVKDYMEKGKVPSLTMNDSKTHAHWTYNMTPAAAPPPDGEGGEEAPKQ